MDFTDIIGPILTGLGLLFAVFSKVAGWVKEKNAIDVMHTEQISAHGGRIDALEHSRSGF